jgi:hypothetical protein
MKRFIIAAVLSILVFSGCTAGNFQGRVPGKYRNGIISNSYKFERITLENAPRKIKNIYEQEKKEREIIISNDGNYTYIIALIGQKPTAGYDAKVQSIEDNEEGKLKITVKFTEPEKGSITAQVITYPYDIIKISKTDLPFYGVDTAGKAIKVEKE